MRNSTYTAFRTSDVWIISEPSGIVVKVFPNEINASTCQAIKGTCRIESYKNNTHVLVIGTDEKAPAVHNDTTLTRIEGKRTSSIPVEELLYIHGRIVELEMLALERRETEMKVLEKKLFQRINTVLNFEEEWDELLEKDEFIAELLS